MKHAAGIALIAGLTLFPNLGRSEEVAVFLSDGSSSLGSSAASLLMILKAEIARSGLTVARDLADQVSEVSEVRDSLVRRGIQRVFVLSSMPLGTKMIALLSEWRTDGTVVFEARMTASTIEEMDTVIPRLVQAVLSRKPPESTAEVTTVTDQEARPWRKKPGEFLWGLAVDLGTPIRNARFIYGLSLHLCYELEHARLGAELSFATDFEHAGYWNPLSIAGYWVPLAQDISPFLGAAIGYGGTFVSDDSERRHARGILFSLVGGVEFFRLSSVRMLASVRFVLPTFRTDLSREDRWVPFFLFGTAILF